MPDRGLGLVEAPRAALAGAERTLRRAPAWPCCGVSTAAADSKSITTTESRPQKVASSLTVPISKGICSPNASRIPSATRPSSLSLRSSPARTPQRMAFTGALAMASISERTSRSTASEARSGPCTVTKANLPRPALATSRRMRSASSRM